MSDESKAEVRSGTQNWAQRHPSFSIEAGDWVSVVNPKQESHAQFLQDMQAGPVNKDASQAVSTGHVWS